MSVNVKQHCFTLTLTFLYNDAAGNKNDNAEDKMRMQVGRKIYLLRKNAGITQEQLSEQLNVSRQTISKWESGVSLPDVESVVAISKLFQVSLNDLLMDTLEEENENKEKCEENIAEDLYALEEFVRINRRNRVIVLVITAIFIFLLGIALGSIFVKKLDNTTSQIEYTLHQYMELPGQYTSLVQTNANEQVLLVTEATYDDGTGRKASFCCDVYYTVNNKVKLLGSIMGAGTAYPIAADWTGIYAAGGHYVERYEIEESSGKLILAEGVYEIYDTDGNVTFEKETEGVRMESSEEELMELVAAYTRATTVSFE